MKPSHVLTLILLVTACAGSADIQPSAVFSDHMVLQRGQEIRIWGSATPGSRVKAFIAGTGASGITNDKGAWMISLPALEAGGPYEVEVTGRGYKKVYTDVMIGDVWVASGQSNMEWQLKYAFNAEQEIAEADDGDVRHFAVPRRWEAMPSDSAAGGPWFRADSEAVKDFSAVAYFFAREIRAHHDVPIGILHTSWGGSRIEPWMRMETLNLELKDMEAILAEEEVQVEQILSSVRDRLGTVPTVDEGLIDGFAVWADPDLDESDWHPIDVPARWETQGFDGVDGVGWYRTSFELTAEQANKEATLRLGPIDDGDQTWVNGTLVGARASGWNVPRVYTIPSSALREGRNVITVRATDNGGDGGIRGTEDQFGVRIQGIEQPLSGPWVFRLGEVRAMVTPAKNRQPVGIFNGMIHPFLPFAIKGAVWYQGESNALSDDAFAYRDQFASMITDWRSQWGLGDFPFLWVQLANFRNPSDHPEESSWALLRESQSDALRVPNTGEAVIIDIGEAADIHPRNKQEAGRRLALAARKIAYQEDIVYSGPRFQSYDIEGSAIRIDFDHTGTGLEARARPTQLPLAEGKAKEGILSGFSIAGPNRRFVWADARIDGSSVVVSSPDVPSPVAVRYGWADNPETANLYNAEGLPASPFRTDTW